MNPQRAFQFLVYCFAIIGFALTAGYLAVKTGLTNENGIIDNQNENFIGLTNSINATNIQTRSLTIIKPTWANSEEWAVLSKAITKDSETMSKAAKDANIKSRLLIAILVPEQLRLFHSEREIFKKIFAPLQILGNQNQFSWGIMGIKQETAREIEDNLKNPSSTYFLGKSYENILNFSTSTDNISQERFERLTNEKDHYYNYLYASLFVRQIMESWLKSGYDIQNRPEILATLFNVGFKNSRPKENPQSGGSLININDKQYSFGQLAGEFYYSNELIEEFPR